MSAPDFATACREAIEASVLAMIRKGDWLSIPYDRRVMVDIGFLRSVYEALDRDRIRALVRERVEERVADALYNSIATEIANDTKQIMCNKELREEVRSLLRAHVRKVSE